MDKFSTNIKPNALQGLANGVAQAAAVVKPTMGAAGTNVIIQIENHPYHQITNDGATIIENLHFEDPIENMGLQLLKEVVARSNKTAGDGSTTTVTLCEAILNEGMKTGKRTMDIKKSLDECLPIIEKAIDDQKKIITPNDYERIKQVATISAEDETLGEILAKIYSEIGANGIIEPDYILGKEGYEYEPKQGVRFAWGAGYLVESMVHDEQAIKEGRKETRAVYENPLILVTKTKLKSVREINPILNKIGQSDLIIFADDMDSEVQQHLINRNQYRKENPDALLPRITVVKCPIVWRDYIYQDFAKCTGATIVAAETGVNFKNFDVTKHFGTCEKIIVEREETRLFGTAGLEAHIAELQAVIDAGKDNEDQDFYRRVCWLQEKTVLLKIGGMSDTELTYKRLKAEDAINATKTALQDGIVCGGGLALLNASKALPDTLGGNILKEALLSPFRQVASNAGIVDDTYTSYYGGSNGFDAKTGNAVDMWDAGIVDSAKITKKAVRNAIGIISTLLTVSSGVVLPPKQEQLAPPKGFPFQ